MGPRNRLPGSARCAGPSRFTLTESGDLSHLIQATQGLGRVSHVGARTHRRWLPDPSTLPQVSLQTQTTMGPKLLTLLAFSLLSSPPDINSWCNPRNNMDKFLACYFWQLLPPRKEGDYTVGYSGKLARQPQIRFLAHTALMINPGQAEQTVSTSECVWKGQRCAGQPAYAFRRCYLFIKYI